MAKRQFVDLEHGQLHLRTAGEGRPLLPIHGSPGSALQLVPMIARFAATHRVIAPDTPGNGDSPALPMAEPTIGDFARVQLQLLDALGIDKVDVYGTHTGAATAVELALLAPERVGRLVLDGVGLFTPEVRDEMLARYAHPFTPDLEGAYLARAFTFCRDMFLFFPWYDRTPRGRRPGGMPPTAVVHGLLMEVLKAAETYPIPYRAAMTWPGRERLPLLRHPALVMSAADDPLLEDSREALGLVAGGEWLELPGFGDADFAAARFEGMQRFLG